MSDNMKIIDFSNGIRSEEIQHNFNITEQQIARERLSVAGYGISTGLSFIINNFNLKITEGSLIDIDGKEIFFNETTLIISLPKLTSIEHTMPVNTNGIITLPNIPYSTNRKMPSQYALPSDRGITITDFNNTSTTYKVLSIDQNKLSTNIIRNTTVNVKYNYTGKRYDTIYISDDYKIKVYEGLTSTSPSISLPSSYKYILGFVEVNGFYMNSDGAVQAKISVKKDTKSLRNVYTDEKNELYISGVPFKNLQIINTFEPTEPEENTLWYDDVSNKLRVWKTVDGLSQWVNINDISIIPVLEYKIWTPEMNPSDRQTFLFDANSDMNMKFVPNRNSLEILIDQAPLHSDQFDEITIADVINNSAIKQELIEKYHYTEDDFNKFNGEYENIGIGFKLANKLDANCYVECKATHRVNENPVMKRFQRTATFVATGNVVYNSLENNTEFETAAPYEFGENQLEVYADGKRLTPGIDYIEGTDLVEEQKVKGATTKKFKVVKQLIDKDIVAYKITTNIYSYDHVEKIIEDVTERLVSAESVVEDVVDQMNTLTLNTNNTLNNFQTTIDQVVNKEQEHASFVKNTDVLALGNMPDEVVNWIPKGFINISIQKSGSIMQTNEISPEDFVILFDMQSSGGNNILRRDIDYKIERDSVSENVYLNFVNGQGVDSVADGHLLYITGIKLKA